MQTITKQFNVFTYEELSKKAKEKVNEWYCETLIYDWWDCVYDQWEEKLEELGYYDIKINFSGFWSQGDGASFIGKINVPLWIEKNNTEKYKRIKGLDYSVVIKRDRWHNYVHWNTTSLYFEETCLQERHQNLIVLVEQLEEEIFAQHQQFNRDIYSDLENEYDWLTSEEQIKESCNVNDYTFLENGRFYI